MRPKVIKPGMLRVTLVAMAIGLAHASAAAGQVPDSVFAVNRGGSTLMRLNQDAGFFVAGTANTGGVPVTGAGIRMMWVPAKWAFRAGKVDGNGSAYWDYANLGVGSVAFGENTRASGANSFAIGKGSIASGAESVAMGDSAVASGDRAFAFNGVASNLGAVAIGVGARASSEDALALGADANAAGLGSIAIGPSSARGSFSMAIGSNSGATAAWSYAIGRNARANHIGSVVIGDRCGLTDTDTVYATGRNQFVVRACGGIKLYTNKGLTAGVEVAPGGGSWSVVSDRNRKMNFLAVDGEDVLARLRSVPVTTWSYSTQDASIRHMGPVAQDFRAAFGLGQNDVTINTIDIDGVNLAGVKALDARTLEHARTIDTLREQVAESTKEVDELKRRIERIEAALSGR